MSEEINYLEELVNGPFGSYEQDKAMKHIENLIKRLHQSHRDKIKRLLKKNIPMRDRVREIIKILKDVPIIPVKSNEKSAKSPSAQESSQQTSNVSIGTNYGNVYLTSSVDNRTVSIVESFNHEEKQLKKLINELPETVQNEQKTDLDAILLQLESIKSSLHANNQKSAQISADGLVKASENIREIATNVYETVQKIFRMIVNPLNLF